MPINASHEYFAAEKIYLAAKTLDEKISALEELMKVAPKHKSSENLLAELKTRLKKLREKKEKAKKTGRSTKKAIRKENFQCALIGLPNSGKSSLLKCLTNARPRIEQYPFTTTQPEIGTMSYEGVKVQIIDFPPIGSERLDKGLLNTADCLIIVIEKLSDLEKIEPCLSKAQGSRIIALNKSDLLSSEEQRKIEATIKAKRLQAINLSALTHDNIEQLKKRIFEQMNIIRIYTKEPGKPPSSEPIVLPEESTIKAVAESILKGFSLKIKETKVTGPSSKFPNQKVGLSHICKDKDIVEFHTK